MKIERLKKNHKKEIIIGGLITLGIVSAITLVTTKAKYKSSESIPLVSGTINYKPYDFKTIAMYQSEDGTNYTEINEMPSSGYVVNEEKTYCTTDNKAKVKGKIKTIDGNVAISNLSKSDKCYIWFDKELSPSEKTLAKLNITTTKESPTTFTGVATTDEGVYAVSDGMYGGTSYYYRGAITNNYVTFAGFYWRIIRINGDGSIRLIYDGTTCHPNGTSTSDSLIQTTTYQYNASYDQSNYVGWTYTGTSQRTAEGTSSNAKTQTEIWFDSNITETNLSRVDTSAKYCNDRDVASGSTWAINGSSFNYATYKRTMTDRQPTLSCPSGDVYTLNVGLITADEIMFAGGWNANNTSYYLYNGQNYWTMSPSYWGSVGYAYVFIVNTTGSLGNYGVYNARGLRPVINLKADITFSSGDGTLNSPYIVAD